MKGLWSLLLAILLCLPCAAQSLDDPPPGIRPGLLLETPDERLRAVSIDEAPGYRRIPLAQWPDLVAARHNTSWWTWLVLNQGQNGSCASESKDGGIMLVRERQGLPRIQMNPLGTYGRVNGGSDSGSTLSSNLAFAQQYGCFPESVWPRSRGWRQTPSAEAYEAAARYKLRAYYRIPNGDWEAFGSAMLNGFVVYWGYSGHAIVGVDVVSKSSFRYLNSWGSWGGSSPHNSELSYGFGVIDKSKILWGYGAYAFLEVEHEVAP